MPVANYNYTGRRRINLKDASVQLLDRDDDFVSVNVRLNLKKIKSSHKHKIIIDGFAYNNLERHALKHTEEQTVDFTGFDAQSSPQFRIKLIATEPDKNGLVLASTRDIRPKSKEKSTKKESFFEPKPTHQNGSVPWLVQWEGDPANPELLINSDLIEIYGDWKNPQLQALYLPATVKECLLGIITRVTERPEDMDKDSFACKLMYFCHDILKVDFPEEDYFQEESISSDWLNWVEECVEAFCAKRWRNNKTLLNNMLENKE